MEFPSDKALKTYLKKHPKADPSAHSVARTPPKLKSPKLRKAFFGALQKGSGKISAGLTALATKPKTPSKKALAITGLAAVVGKVVGGALAGAVGSKLVSMMGLSPSATHSIGQAYVQLKALGAATQIGSKMGLYDVSAVGLSAAKGLSKLSDWAEKKAVGGKKASEGMPEEVQTEMMDYFLDVSKEDIKVLRQHYDEKTGKLDLKALEEQLEKRIGGSDKKAATHKMVKKVAARYLNDRRTSLWG